MNKNIFLKIASVIFVAIFVLTIFTSCGRSDDVYIPEKNNSFESPSKGDVSTGFDSSTNSNVTPNSSNHKIIRDMTLFSETKDYESTIKTLKEVVSNNNGYIESQRFSKDSTYYYGNYYQVSGYLKIRIPSENLDSFINQTSGIMNVLSSSESVSDVTLTYYDLQSRLDTLKTKKVALEAMLQKATTVQDMIYIQDSLYSTIADIESYQTQLNHYDNRITYSTIDLTLYEVVSYTPVEEPTFWSRIGESFRDSWHDFGEGWKDFAVFFVGAIPTLIILFAIGVAIFFIVKAIIKKQRKKAALLKEESKESK